MYHARLRRLQEEEKLPPVLGVLFLQPFPALFLPTPSLGFKMVALYIYTSLSMEGGREEDGRSIACSAVPARIFQLPPSSELPQIDGAIGRVVVKKTSLELMTADIDKD
ncbi:hypothetical protein GW17_00018902 [Ensete ventricosum]|nr:hypothetical protein GW17_00018902 [Ensete ventricosum]